jgi:hypothetical protein
MPIAYRLTVIAAAVYGTYVLPLDIFGTWYKIRYISQSRHSSLATEDFFVYALLFCLAHMAANFPIMITFANF